MSRTLPKLPPCDVWRRCFGVPPREGPGAAGQGKADGSSSRLFGFAAAGMAMQRLNGYAARSGAEFWPICVMAGQRFAIAAPDPGRRRRPGAWSCSGVIGRRRRWENEAGGPKAPRTSSGADSIPARFGFPSMRGALGAPTRTAPCAKSAELCGPRRYHAPVTAHLLCRW